MLPLSRIKKGTKPFQLSLLSAQERGALFWSSLLFFFALVGYSGARSVSTALFLQKYGSSATPLWNFYSIIALSIVVSFYNLVQKKVGARRVFQLNAFLTVVIFTLGLRPQWWGSTAHVGPLYVWKEIHIVLFLHLGWAYLINTVQSDHAKAWFGPVAAIGSIGGVLGGVLIGAISQQTAMAIVVFSYAAAALCFSFAPQSSAASAEKGTSRSPLASLRQVRTYVLYLSAFVALSQVVIGILEFLLYKQVGVALPALDAKTRYLGSLNAWMNGVSLVFKVTLVPFVLARIRASTLQAVLPLSYVVLALALLPGFGTASVAALWSVTLAYAVVKGADYSLMSLGKELLYYPLNALERYGAKYISDIWVYRFAKAGASFLLIWVQAERTLFALLIGTLLLWASLGYRLARDSRAV